MNPRSAIVLTLAVTVVCLAGDYFLKKASNAEHPFRRVEFFVGMALFSISAFGWVYAFRVLKLGTIGVVYGVSTVLFMALLGWAAFGETLRWHEMLGILLGIMSILLLARFA